MKYIRIKSYKTNGIRVVIQQAEGRNIYVFTLSREDVKMRIECVIKDEVEAIIAEKEIKYIEDFEELE